MDDIDEYDHHYFVKDGDDDEIEEETEEILEFPNSVFIPDGDGSFSKEFDAKLIDTVKDYPCLYSHKLRYSEEEIDEAWALVASQLQQSVEGCQYRWKRLRQYYAKERAKRAKPTIRRKKWILFERMAFLAPHVMKRKYFRKPIDTIVAENQGDFSENSSKETVVFHADELDINDYFDLQLIENLKSYPCIYDPQKKQSKKDELKAWQLIAQELESSVEECVSRYRRLRQYYAKERAKREVYGDGYRKWVFYDIMSFLEPYIKRRMTVRILSQNLEEYYSISNDGIEEDNETFYDSDDFDKKLLEEIKKNPCVYDTNKRLSYNSEADAWENISRAVLQSVEVCQSRYVRLRQYYAKERQKRETTNNLKKKWSLFDEMEFMGPFIKKRKLISNTEVEEEKPIIEIPRKPTEKPKVIFQKSTQSYFFNEEFDYTLVSLVKKYPGIYDLRRRQSAEEIAEAWKVIAAELNTEAALCEKRFIRLRQYYAKERQKKEQNRPHREWPFFNVMSYFGPFIKKRNCAHVKRKKKPADVSLNQEVNINASSDNEYIYDIDDENEFQEFIIDNHTTDSHTTYEIDDSKDYNLGNFDSDSYDLETKDSDSQIMETENYPMLESVLEHKNFVAEVDNDDDLIETIKNENGNFVVNYDDNPVIEEVSNEEESHVIITNNVRNEDDQKDLTFKPCDEEKLKALISASATDVATSFYWPDFTMTVIKKKKR